MWKTLYDLYEEDNSILAGVDVPEPFTDETAKAVILMRCRNVVPIYQNSADFKTYTALWFATHQIALAHLAKVAQADYSPIENTDRFFTRTETVDRDTTKSTTDTHSGSDVDSITHGETETHSGSDSNSTTYGKTETHGGSDDRTIENEFSGFDSETYVNANKSTDSTDFGETITNGGTDTERTQHGHVITKGGTDSKSTQYGHVINGSETGTDNATTEITERTHGNIGVTSNQQMLSAELELLPHFALYDTIASLFETDNFICCYDVWEGMTNDDCII